MGGLVGLRFMAEFGGAGVKGEGRRVEVGLLLLLLLRWEFEGGGGNRNDK